MLNVPSTWSQRELCSHLQSLYGACLVFTLGGKQLKELHDRLCDANLTPYSLVLLEPIKLKGGSTRIASTQAAGKSGAADTVNQSVELESARLLAKDELKEE